jgi:hypothetical protein
MASLLDFWPDAEHCDDCLKNEAETAADAVFLAVHQPMHLLRQVYQPQNTLAEVKTEDDLLKALLARTPSGTLILPITGASGVGKSHMIRWLDACLRLRPDQARRHVVRVPKSASLKRVLALILEGLAGEGYAVLRERLTSAQMPPTPEKATWQLLAEMLSALDESANTAKQAIAAGDNPKANALKKAYCQGLNAILKDSHLEKFFTAHDGGTPGALARIAARCIQGSPDVEEAGRSQFLESDLRFVPDVSLAEMAGPARAFVALLRTAGPSGVQEALRHLNEAVDPAVQAMINFNGVTLTDLLLEVRQELLKDNLELVLLIEDFAALAGIQRSLLDAIIYHGVDSGDQGLCIMRTALAVTEGYLTNKETVRTRAQAEWRIENKPFKDGEEAVDNFTDFVGGYLNAARWGAAQLQKDFRAGGKGEQRSGDWVRNYLNAHEGDLSERDRAALEAFGKSKRGDYPLFPFNRGSVRQMARQYLLEGGIYKFEPRLLINRILQGTLLNYRDAFENGGFPTPGLHGLKPGKLDQDVENEIRSKATGELQRNRLEALVYFWGDDPRSLEKAAALEREVYEAFGLTRLDWLARAGRKGPAPEKTAVNPVGHPPPEPVPTTDPSALPGAWQSTLDAWRADGDLAQGPANALRGMLYTAIHEWIDWDAILLKCPPAARNKKIFLHGAKQGNPSSGDTLAVALSEEKFNNPEQKADVFRAIRAVIRYDDRKTWNYQDGEEDAASYANYIGGLAAEAATYYESKGSVQPPGLVKPLVHALLIGARLLNLKGASTNIDTDNIAAVFRPAPDAGHSAPPGADAWTTLKASASKARDGLKTLLVTLVASYQGEGEKPQGIDATRLLDAISELRATDWQLAALPEVQDLDLAIRDHFRELKKLPSVAEKRRAELAQREALVRSAFGEQFDAPALATELIEVAKKAQDAGVFRPEEPKSDVLRKEVREMGPVTETLNQTGRASQPGVGFGVKLSALAQIDDRTFSRVESVVADYKRFFDDTLAEVTERLGDHPPDPDTTAAELDAEFEELKSLWLETLQTSETK